MATKRKPSISGMKRPELVSRDRRTRSRREKLFGVEALSVICGGMKTLEQHPIVRLPRQAVTCRLPEYLPAFGRDQQFLTQLPAIRSPWLLPQDERTSLHKRQ